MNVRPRLSQWSQVLTLFDLARLFLDRFLSRSEFVRLSIRHVNIGWRREYGVGHSRLTIVAMTD
jgi:hypothetical protein